MNLFSIMTISDIIGILTLLVSCIAIGVALYISHKSTKDNKQLILSHKDNTDAQINEIRIASRNEIKEFRTLIHTLLASTIYHLANENNVLAGRVKETERRYLELLNRYEQIKDCKLEETSTINVNEININFAEKNWLKESIQELKTNNEYFKKSADHISVLLDHFISLDKQLTSNKQYE